MVEAATTNMVGYGGFIEIEPMCCQYEAGCVDGDY